MQVLKLRGKKALRSTQYHGIHSLLHLVAVRSHNNALGILGDYFIALSGRHTIKRHETKPRRVTEFQLAEYGSDSPLFFT